jgi:hypothetical protein
MGILDDAIREHLELKRAHGANEDELRRKEAEAFGPMRQEAVAQPLEGDATQMLHPGDADAPPAGPLDLEPEPLEPSEPDSHLVHPADHPIPDPHDHAHPAGSDPAWGEDTEFFAEPVPPPAAEQPVHHHDDEPHPALHDHDAIHAEEHPPEPVFRERAEAPVQEPPVRRPPVDEPPVDEPPVEAGDEEDVLEDTPEFLQDAPEHDRLWFEQKPPRDFDFGE